MIRLLPVLSSAEVGLLNFPVTFGGVALLDSPYHPVNRATAWPEPWGACSPV